jgi:hypothetical protein
MNNKQIKKSIEEIKKQLEAQGKTNKLNVFERIEIAERIFGSDSFRAYKEALEDGKPENARVILAKIPENERETFLGCYETEVYLSSIGY